MIKKASFKPFSKSPSHSSCPQSRCQWGFLSAAALHLFLCSDAKWAAGWEKAEWGRTREMMMMMLLLFLCSCNTSGLESRRSRPPCSRRLAGSLLVQVLSYCTFTCGNAGLVITSAENSLQSPPPPQRHIQSWRPGRVQTPSFPPAAERLDCASHPDSQKLGVFIDHFALSNQSRWAGKYTVVMGMLLPPGPDQVFPTIHQAFSQRSQHFYLKKICFFIKIIRSHKSHLFYKSL